MSSSYIDKLQEVERKMQESIEANKAMIDAAWTARQHEEVKKITVDGKEAVWIIR